MSKIFNEAEQLINKEKREEYGPVMDSLNGISVLWSALLGKEIDPQDVCLCMIALKLYREGFRHKKDNLVDICGYIKCLAILYDEDGSC